jgi:hypothetical protein
LSLFLNCQLHGVCARIVLPLVRRGGILRAIVGGGGWLRGEILPALVRLLQHLVVGGALLLQA